MRAGELRHKITFQTKAQASDNMGAAGSETWSDTYADEPAAIWPLKGAEAIEGMKLEHKVTHKIRIRYRSGVTADMRIEWGFQYFEIISIINPDERNIMLDILATEIVT